MRVPSCSTRSLVVACLLLVASSRLHGQATTMPASRRPEASVSVDRGPPEPAEPVRRIVDSLQAAGVPGEPLIAKAQEGSRLGAPPARIVAALTALARRLGAARDALGAVSTTAELVAGADALAAGVPPEVLREMRRARPAYPVTVPLVVLTDLVVRGISPDVAAPPLVRLAQTRKDDPRLLDMGHSVERDIAAGLSPVRALTRQMDRMTATLPPFGPLPPATTIHP